jgi:hypothetical protein
VDDCCKQEPGSTVDKNTLFVRYREWCEHHEKIGHPGTKEAFGKKLRAVVSTIKTTRGPEANKKRPWLWLGLRLLKADEEPAAEPDEVPPPV